MKAMILKELTSVGQGSRFLEMAEANHALIKLKTQKTRGAKVLRIR